MAPDVKSEAIRYASLGMSVIPVQANKRALTHTVRGRLLPDGGWTFAQREPSSVDVVEDWFTKAPGAGVAIVCGGVSGNLVVLDIDDRELCTFIKSELGLVLETTWVVSTGSGKIHMYLRSKKVAFTTAINTGRIHLADIRSDGHPPYGPSYVVAPPSPYNFNGVVGIYSTLHGSPDCIREVEDAGVWLHSFVTKSYKALTGKYEEVVQAVSVSMVPDSIKPPGDTIEVEEWVDAAGVTGRIRRAIMEGATPGQGEWAKSSSRSEIDHHIVMALREGGLSNDQIETIFATCAIGEGCYRNADRPQHGYRYLKYSFDKADARLNESIAASASAEGINFNVERVVRVAYEPPVYEVYVVNNAGEHGIVKVDSNQILRESKFKDAVARDMNFVARLKPHHEGRGFSLFAEAIMKLVVNESPPEDATDQGIISGRVLAILQRDVKQSRPDKIDEAAIGWRNGNQAMYIRGDALQQRVAQGLRQVPAPSKVWEVLRGMGGTSTTYVDQPTGKVLKMWRVPTSAVDRG